MRVPLIIMVLLSNILYPQEANNKIMEEPKFLIHANPSASTKYLPLLQKQFNIAPGLFPNPIGISVTYTYSEENYYITRFAVKPGSLLSLLLGKEEKNWQLSKGISFLKTHSVGVKMDTYLLPFLQLFGMLSYIKVEQLIQIGTATVMGRFNRPFKVNIPDMKNNLDGFLGLGGMNLVFSYKGFLMLLSVAGGYVRLDNRKEEIKGFISQPVLYVAPRIGYSYGGIFTGYAGVQYIKTFGKNQGQGLVNLSEQIVKSYSVEVEKFPVNFIVGFQWMLSRILGINIEYAGSPDSHGVSIDTMFRF